MGDLETGLFIGVAIRMVLPAPVVLLVSMRDLRALGNIFSVAQGIKPELAISTIVAR